MKNYIDYDYKLGLSGDEIERIKNLVSNFNDFIQESKKKNKGEEIGVVLYGKKWEEKEHYTKAEFIPEEEKLILYFWEEFSPHKIHKDEYYGEDSYTDTGLKNGLENMKNIIRRIKRVLNQRDKTPKERAINEGVKLLEKLTGKKAFLKEESDFRKNEDRFRTFKYKGEKGLLLEIDAPGYMEVDERETVYLKYKGTELSFDAVVVWSEHGGPEGENSTGFFLEIPIDEEKYKYYEKLLEEERCPDDLKSVDKLIGDPEITLTSYLKNHCNKDIKTFIKNFGNTIYAWLADVVYEAELDHGQEMDDRTRNHYE